MKVIVLLTTVVMFLTNCGPLTYTVHINNQSNTTFDSIVVRITSTQGKYAILKFTEVLPNQVIQKTILSSVIKAQHDIMVAPKMYIKDSLIMGRLIYNDLGIFRANYKMTIDSALQVKWEEWD